LNRVDGVVQLKRNRFNTLWFENINNLASPSQRSSHLWSQITQSQSLQSINSAERIWFCKNHMNCLWQVLPVFLLSFFYYATSGFSCVIYDKEIGALTSISASSVYPTVSLLMSTENGSSRGTYLDERSSGSFPRMASRTTVQSSALLQKGPSLSCKSNVRY